MLKHATPRSSPSLSSTTPDRSNKKLPDGEPSSPGSKLQDQLIKLPECDSVLPKSTKSSYNERGVDCEGIVAPLQNSNKKCGGPNSSGLSLGDLLGEKILSLGNLSVTGSGIGPVITHGKAIVRRGLSFNTKRDSDSVSVRSIKSEGRGFDFDEAKKNQVLSKANSVMSLPTKAFKEIGKTAANNEEKCPNEPKTKNTRPNNEKPLTSRSLNKKIFGISKNDHPSLKSLLRLPGVYGHIPVPESAPFGTPHILSPDSLSLNSSVSFISSNSGRTSSRSWSSNASSNSNNTSDSSNSNCSSTSEPTSTTLKIFAKCLRSDIEYKTVNVGSKATCRQLINILLSKARMRHRDPNLFYLTMEVTVRRWSGVPVRALLVLEESARPAQLALCRPSGDLKFVLQMRMGGIIKIHDTVLMPGSQYKSLLISYRTTAEDAVQLLLNCYGRKDSKHYYALHELCQSPHYKDRRLGQSEKPLEVKAEWPKDRRAEYVFVLRRNMTPALSLRKLSQRTLEQIPSKDERPENIPEERDTAEAEPNKRTIEETVIDCTSITPVMITLVREEKDKTWERTSQTEDTSTLSRLKNTREGSFQNEDPLPRIKGTMEPTSQNEATTALPRIKETNERTFRNENTNILHRLKDPKERNLLENTNPIPRRDTRERNFQLGETNVLNRLNDTGNMIHSASVTINDAKRLENKSPEVSNLFSSRWQNSSCRVSFHSLPKDHMSKEKNSIMSTEVRTNQNITPIPVYRPNSFSQSTKLSVLPKAPNELVNKSTNTKFLSSCAVQTELTCIPVRGLRTKYKWNSVETLLESHYTPQRSLQNNHKACMDNISSGKPNLFPTVNKAETHVSREFHHQNRNCNCQTCFYI